MVEVQEVSGYHSKSEEFIIEKLTSGCVCWTFLWLDLI